MVVVGATVDVDVVEVVVVEVLVVVLELTTASPKVAIVGTRKLLRVLYPETVRCTPSTMNRLFDRGVNAVFQSAMLKLEQQMQTILVEMSAY